MFMAPFVNVTNGPETEDYGMRFEPIFIEAVTPETYRAELEAQNRKATSAQAPESRKRRRAPPSDGHQAEAEPSSPRHTVRAVAHRPGSDGPSASSSSTGPPGSVANPVLNLVMKGSQSAHIFLAGSKSLPEELTIKFPLIVWDKDVPHILTRDGCLASIPRDLLEPNERGRPAVGAGPNQVSRQTHPPPASQPVLRHEPQPQRSWVQWPIFIQQHGAWYEISADRPSDNVHKPRALGIGTGRMVRRGFCHVGQGKGKAIASDMASPSYGRISARRPLPISNYASNLGVEGATPAAGPDTALKVEEDIDNQDLGTSSNSYEEYNVSGRLDGFEA